MLSGNLQCLEKDLEHFQERMNEQVENHESHLDRLMSWKSDKTTLLDSVNVQVYEFIK